MQTSFFSGLSQSKGRKQGRYGISRKPTPCWVQKFAEIVHAFLGSDTTSRLHGIGKGVALTKIRTDVLFRQQADVLSRDGATKYEIILAGENSLLWVYNGRSEEDLFSGAREPSTYVCSCCFSQPEGLLPGTAMERCIAECGRVEMEVDRWKTAVYTNGPAAST